MADSWRKAYGELRDYTTSNHVIEISGDAVIIPGDVRPEFYRLFAKVCVSFGKDNIPTLLEKGYALSKKWGDVSQSVMNDLKLKSIDADDSVKWYLLDPDDSLMRILFDPLFDLLKGKNDLAAFEQTAIIALEDRFPKLHRGGYQCWATVSLLKLLSADKVYDIPRSDFDRDPTNFHELPHGDREENAPDAEETKRISFEHNHMFSFMVPKVIVRSTRLDRFMAFVSDFNFNEARWRARYLSPEQEWFGVSDIVRDFGQGDLWPDLAVYTGTNIKELVVIADYFEMARPDIIVEFRDVKDWYEEEGLGPIRRHYNVLKPRLGTFVICREPVPKTALEELEPNPELPQPEPHIHLLSVGYDQTNLEPIIEAMVAAKNKVKETKVGNTPA